MSIAELPDDVLPTHLDLPCTDGKPVDNEFQPLESMLLRIALEPHLDRLHPDGNYFIGSDMGIYWQRTQEPLDGCKAPDWFYVPGVPRMLEGELRRSYVLWQEKVHPLLVIEYVSGSGAEERDATPGNGKFWVYEQIIQARYYLIYDFEREELTGFELLGGKYEPMEQNDKGHIAIPAMKVEFGIWYGQYRKAFSTWLRGWDLEGRLLPNDEESGKVDRQRAEQAEVRAEQERLRAEGEQKRAEQADQRAEEERQRAEEERQRAEQADQRAEEERQRAERLAARLRELGIDPNSS